MENNGDENGEKNSSRQNMSIKINIRFWNEETFSFEI